MGLRFSRPSLEDIHVNASPSPLLPSPDPNAPLAPSPSTNSRAQSGLEAGSVIGRKWLLLERVGRGAFGDIFTAECIVKGDPLYLRRVALKIEKLEVADEATVKAALEAEQRLKEREKATAEGRTAEDGPVVPLSPSPLTPGGLSGHLPATLPQPSEPLSPPSPYPSPPPADVQGSGACPPSPTPSSPTPGSSAPPVYMKRCIVKLEAVVLSKLQSSPSFPRFIEYGRDGPQQVAYLAMQLLGDNLLRLRRQQRKLRFGLSTVLRFGVAALKCLQVMHESGFIHRDVKPSNFVVGVGAESGRVYMIDFGLARAYREKGSNAVIPPRQDIGGFRGTPRYASIFVHREQDLSRRDDLWSLLYILVEFITGDLPWGSKRDKAAIGALKERYHSSKLLKGCPSCFLPFFQHLQGLAFETTPDYALLQGLLEGKLKKLKVKADELMDWENAASKAQALTALAEEAVAAPLIMGKVEEEEKERGEEQRMVIVLHPHPHSHVVETRPSLAPTSPPPCKVEEEKEEENSVRLQSPVEGHRQLSSSVSLSYSPSLSAVALSSRYDGAQPASPALSVCGDRASMSGMRLSRGTLDELRDEQEMWGRPGEPVAIFDAVVGVRQPLNLEDSSIHLRRKKKQGAVPSDRQ